MAKADDLRATIEANRKALREAIEEAGAKWEQAAGDDWAPRKIAEHAIGAERYFAGVIATAMQGNPPERQPMELGSSAAAIEAMTAAEADFNRVARYVEDRDLVKAATVTGDYPQTVEGALKLSADHLADHAQQLKQAAS